MMMMMMMLIRHLQIQVDFAYLYMWIHMGASVCAFVGVCNHQICPVDRILANDPGDRVSILG